MPPCGHLPEPPCTDVRLPRCGLALQYLHRGSHRRPNPLRAQIVTHKLHIVTTAWPHGAKRSRAVIAATILFRNECHDLSRQLTPRAASSRLRCAPRAGRPDTGWHALRASTAASSYAGRPNSRKTAGSASGSGSPPRRGRARGRPDAPASCRYSCPSGNEARSECATWRASVSCPCPVVR
jgi:hypothetical protein